MKPTLAIFVSLFVAFCFLARTATAQTVTEASISAGASDSENNISDIYPRWSVVGEWHVTNPDWTDTLTIRADGTHSTSRGSTGRWLLAGDRGEVLLVLRWDLHGTESLTMVAPDHFRGQKRKGRFIDMRRSDANLKPTPEAK